MQQTVHIVPTVRARWATAGFCGAHGARSRCNRYQNVESRDHGCAGRLRGTRGESPVGVVQSPVERPETALEATQTTGGGIEAPLPGTGCYWCAG